MEIQDMFLNGISITGLISAIAFLIILCVKPLRKRMVEYIILKHDKSKCEEVLNKAKGKIEMLEHKTECLQIKIDTLIEENHELKLQIVELKALLTKS